MKDKITTKCEICKEEVPFTYGGKELVEARIFTCGGCGISMHEKCAEIPESDKDEFDSLYDENWRAMPEKFCPYCNMRMITNSVFYLYVLKKYNVKYSEILKEVQEKFKNIDELLAYIN